MRICFNADCSDVWYLNEAPNAQAEQACKEFAASEQAWPETLVDGLYQLVVRSSHDGWAGYVRTR